MDNDFYDSEDIYNMLYRLSCATSTQKNCIRNYILSVGYGIDTEALLNVIDDPMEYNIDYLCSLDSDVTEELIDILHRFGFI